MRLRLVACIWCHRVIWPWQWCRLLPDGNGLHQQCAADVDHIYEQGQEVTGI